tara:strand:+ start:106 stop:264 length:159 start_codon:yes stop_codon:yes gene_type:complete
MISIELLILLNSVMQKQNMFLYKNKKFKKNECTFLVHFLFIGEMIECHQFKI